jgi:hypothetical protein
MGGQGSGRLPSVETIIKRSSPEETPIGDGLFIPNLSGVQSAALKDSAPSTLPLVVNSATIAGMNISNDRTKTTLLGTAGDYNRIGDAGVTSNSLASEDDLLVTGKLEVAGTFYPKTDFSIADGQQIQMGDGSQLCFGAGSDVRMQWEAVASNPDTFHLCLGSDSNAMIITKTAYRNKAHDHALQTNPTVFIHSATDPDTNNTQWLSLAHDQTKGVISTGTGVVSFPTGISGSSILADNGFTGTITTASLVGKTITISGGIIIGFA